MLVFGAAPVPCACLAQMQSIPFLFEKRFEEEFLERPGGILCVEPPPGDRPWGALLEGGVGEAPFWRVVHPLVAAPSASVLDTAYYAELKLPLYVSAVVEEGAETLGGVRNPPLSRTPAGKLPRSVGYWGLDCMLRMAPHGLPEVVPGRKGAEVVRPRIYVLDTPPVFRRGNAFQEHLERGIMEALLASPFRTADPYLADFWYVPGPPSVMEFPRVIAKLRWARDAQPFWNATVAAGISGIGARHLPGDLTFGLGCALGTQILMTSEHGPGEALPDTWRQDVANPQLPHQDLLPPQDLSAASFTRAWAVLRLNGNKDMPYPQVL
eukprot:gene17152-20399_t